MLLVIRVTVIKIGKLGDIWNVNRIVFNNSLIQKKCIKNVIAVTAQHEVTCLTKTGFHHPESQHAFSFDAPA